jgi:tetratricopeptide (TPR) repeat protein
MRCTCRPATSAAMGTAEGYEQSIALYEQALAIDPEYPAAWDGLATNYINMAGNGLLPGMRAMPRPARRRRRRWPSTRITPRPTVASAGSRCMHDNDLAQAARHFERALQLDPNDIRIISNAAAAASPSAAWTRPSHRRVRRCPRPGEPQQPLQPGRLELPRRRPLGRSHCRLRDRPAPEPGPLGAHYHIGMTLLLKGEPEAALESFTREEGDEQPPGHGPGAWRFTHWAGRKNTRPN